MSGYTPSRTGTAELASRYSATPLPVPFAWWNRIVLRGTSTVVRT